MLEKREQRMEQLEQCAQDMGLKEKAFHERMIWLALINDEMSSAELVKLIRMVMATHYRVMPGDGMALYREN